MKKRDKSLKVKKRRIRKDIDRREECIKRCTRLLFRLDRLNRRYFRGDSADIRLCNESLARIVEYVKTMPASWNPRSKGKNAMIPGMKIRIRDGIEKSRMATIKHLGGPKRFYGALIVSEDTPKTFIVKLTDGVKTVAWKRDIEPICEGGPEPVVIDDTPEPVVREVTPVDPLQKKAIENKHIEHALAAQAEESKKTGAS